MSQSIKASAQVPVNDYAPGAKALGNVTRLTTESVVYIGDAACKEIDDAAKSLEEEAKYLADQMRELSVALREQSKFFSNQVSKFGEKATEIADTVKGLKAKIMETNFERAPKQQDNAPVPAFLQEPLREAAE